MCTLHFVMVYVLWRCTLLAFMFWKLYVLELLRCVQLCFVTLRHVRFTLCCFTICSNITRTWPPVTTAWPPASHRTPPGRPRRRRRRIRPFQIPPRYIKILANQEAGVLKKLSLAGLAKLSRLRYSWLRFGLAQIGQCTQPTNSQLIPQSSMKYLELARLA